MDTSLEYSMHTLVLQTRKTGWVARPLLAKFVPIYPTLNLINQESRPGHRRLRVVSKTSISNPIFSLAVA